MNFADFEIKSFGKNKVSGVKIAAGIWYLHPQGKGKKPSRAKDPSGIFDIYETGEIDLWMRSQGFVPHCFLDVKRWSVYPTIFNNNVRTPGNQLLESDIVYIKDPLKLNLLNEDQLKKIAIISHYCFQSVDLSGFIFLELEKRNIVPKDSYKQYILNVKKFK